MVRPSSTFTSAVNTTFGDVEEFGNTIHWYALDADYTTESFKVYLTGIANGGSNDYYRLNDRTPNGVGVTTGNTQLTPVEADYNGWMANIGVDVYLGPFTLMLEGFYITGDEFKDHSYLGQLEFAYMILEYHRYSGKDISQYIDFIKSAAIMAQPD